jgi:ribosome-associated protein
LWPPEPKVEETEPEDEVGGRLSVRSRAKQNERLMAVAEALLVIPTQKWAHLDVSTALKEGLVAAKKIGSHGAKRRQMHYLVQQLRNHDDEVLGFLIDLVENGARRQADEDKVVERWRARVLDDDDALTELFEGRPHADVQKVRTLARSARKEREAEAGKVGKAQTNLLRAIREVLRPPVVAPEEG